MIICPTPPTIAIEIGIMLFTLGARLLKSKKERKKKSNRK